ncbi:MAG: DUF3413 domain-containing protein, partial [Gammaproteobacteria bacterium]
MVHPATLAYVGAVWLTYCAVYLLPVAALIGAVAHLVRWSPVARRLREVRVNPERLIDVVAVVLTTALQFALFMDGFIFRIYGFHFNGFVWNIVSTPGGIESLGADAATQMSFAGIALALATLQTAVLIIARRSECVARLALRVVTRRSVLAATAVLIALAGAERVAYGLSDAGDYRPIVTAANVFPLYNRVRMHPFARRIGIEASRARGVLMSREAVSLSYPLVPLKRAPEARNLNVVWLVAESWRWDMLDAEIMPATTAFAGRAHTFRSHYSGGNGTRMGMFSMFYGLYGSYWFSFLNETRSPAMLDVLVDGGYDMRAFTSAKFTFPEFDKTIFSRFPSEHLREGDPAKYGWENDRANVTELIRSIDQRDTS